MANANAITLDGLDINRGDRCTSWLPLYHDMGLVGFMLVPLTTQMSIDYIATRDFARRSLTWLKLISEYGGTLSYSPSFGYELCTRRLREGTEVKLDLKSWRGAGIGGDMVQHPILQNFAEAFGPYGFRPTAFVPSYGMAETTLAMSFAPLEQALRGRRDRPRRAGGAQPARCPARSGPKTARLRRLRPRAAGPRVRGPRRCRPRAAGAPRRPHLLPRPERHGRLFPAAGDDRRGA